jgi:uncharacterized protein
VGSCKDVAAAARIIALDRGMTGFIEKAHRAAEDARVLEQRGSFESACSRGYFAMFHSARAVLIALDRAAIEIKTHATVVRRFGQIVRAEPKFGGRLGRALNIAEHTRWRADYSLQTILRSDVDRLLADMDDIVDAAPDLLNSKTP